MLSAYPEVYHFIIMFMLQVQRIHVKGIGHQMAVFEPHGRTVKVCHHPLVGIKVVRVCKLQVKVMVQIAESMETRQVSLFFLSF